MQGISTQELTEMQSAIALQTEQNFRNDFNFKRELPENIQFLDELSWNYYWSWQPEATNLFRELDPTLWTKCEQNPRLLLKQIDDLRLWQKANDVYFVDRLASFEVQYRNYLAQPRQDMGRITKENPAAYFCAEYGVHNSLPIYSGGLGILSGDHLKSASDMNVPLVAVGLFYRYGYFRQAIGHDGWQEEHYLNSFDNELALKPVLDEDGERVQVMIHMRGREVYAQAWLAQIGRISLYLLDTNVQKNNDVDRFITGHLYGGDVETRVVQEKILGIGGVRLLRKLGVEPSVFHLNEGHSAFLTLELAREFLAENQESEFERCHRRSTGTMCFYNAHTGFRRK